MNDKNKKGNCYLSPWFDWTKGWGKNNKEFGNCFAGKVTKREGESKEKEGERVMESWEREKREGH